MYGYPALGIGLPLQTSITIGGKDVGEMRPAPLPSALHQALRLLSLGSASIESDIPQGLGFGSSAALCAAVARAVATPTATVAAEPTRQLWREAHLLERAFHGTPSGADTSLALHAGIALLTWSPRNHSADRVPELPQLKPLRCGGLHLVAGAVPRRRSTAAEVARIARAYADAEAGVVDTLSELGRLSERAAQAIGNGENAGAALGALATEAQRGLTELGLASPEQDVIIRAGVDQGASGGKLSGAGGGGAFLLFCESEPVATRVFERLHGRTPVLLQLVASGDHSDVRVAITRSEGLQRTLGRVRFQATAPTDRQTG